jgi:hypothetical protein
MAGQLSAFKVIGDSNIRNAFSTRLKLCERIIGQSAEFVSAEAYSSGLMAMADLGGASTVFVNFLVNGLVDATELCTDFAAIDGVLQDKVGEYLAAMLKAASNNPTTKFYMMPPMTRTTPIWLESRLPAITDTMLARVRGLDNLILLPPFTVLSADLEADGIHLHRKSQSRLFSYIMDSLFPDKSSAKMKNITRDRTESEDEANSPPNKKIAEAIITGTPMDSSSLTADEWVTQGPPSGDVAMAPVALPVNSTAVPTLPPTLSTTAHVHVVAPPTPADVGAVSDDGAELANPELKQLYQMLSKKMDVAHDVTSGVQVRVG